MTEYFIDDELTAAVGDLIQDVNFSEFGPLREHDVEFLCAYVLKSDNEGEEKPTSGPPVVIRKISPSDKVFVKGHYKLYVDRTRWKDVGEQQQRAMLHRALMGISIEKVKDKVKFGTRKPDIIEFHATVVRFGAWTDELLTLRSNLEEAKARRAGRSKVQAEEAAA